MARQATFKHDIVEPFMRKYPKHSTRGLATLIWNDEKLKAKEVWRDYEALRKFIMFKRGANGCHSKEIKNKYISVR